jgi:hypothetical protein
LGAPSVAHGVDTKGGVQHKEHPADAGQQETTEPTDSAGIKQTDEERQRQTRRHDGDIVPVLPHDKGGPCAISHRTWHLPSG